MARKITLTVPDDLYHKIDRWRSGFNLSRIFQDAVGDAIRKKEDFQKRMGEDTSLNDVIARLKKEKENWEERLAFQAEKAGTFWASNAHYEDLILAVNTKEDQVLQIPQVQKQISDTIQQLCQFPEALQERLENIKATVQEGWLKGVKNFWETVGDKL
ncbi:hypothetical protein [Oceanispirochaeta sp.]|jgi:metal-responsive CopG/Arc/MetJ family transcriptional regulator|uniref:hypothetical protein n=1 Tax=Oceanispirochaeta sp. TaxID=2035350 RepID=UPI00260B1E19|nr:hypothetical protein [Oceanispirochaeta sp.]MDA3955833.1 hypothetical protein [Oceanispirochaeta sp.]